MMLGVTEIKMGGTWDPTGRILKKSFVFCSFFLLNERQETTPEFQLPEHKFSKSSSDNGYDADGIHQE
jgi:hypothetical protein